MITVEKAQKIVPVKKAVDYNKVASTYNRRFAEDNQKGIESTLISLARECKAKNILEAGCGTGHWLGKLVETGSQILGLDLSFGMLSQAAVLTQFPLIQGRAENLPLRSDSFDLVYCVNAIHHFDRPQDFIYGAKRLLHSGGGLAIIGMEPPRKRDDWFIYQYFEGTYETDLKRYPSLETIQNWMAIAGLSQIKWRVVERISNSLVGQAIFDYPFLRKDSTSQLILLTDEMYDAGLRRIHQALEKAEAQQITIRFPVEISISMVSGRAF